MGFLDDVLWRANFKKDQLVFKAKYMRLRTLYEFDCLFGGVKMELGWAIDDTVAAIKNKFKSNNGTSPAMSDEKVRELAVVSCQLEAMKEQMTALNSINDKEHLKRCQLGIAVAIECATSGVVPISIDKQEAMELMIFGVNGTELAPPATKELADVMYSQGVTLEEMAKIIENSGFTSAMYTQLYMVTFAYMLDINLEDPDSITPEALKLLEQWENLTSDWQ